jgi:serralysin
MDGGTGIGSDTAYYSSEKTGAIINLLDQTLNAGSADGDMLFNFESIFGSNIAADNITGGNGNETILGNGGNDILNGSGGGDTMRGGAGTDTLNGGTGADKFQYTALNEVGDIIVTYEAIDDFQFTRAAFGNLAGTNVAAVNFLSVATGHAATTANHRFIFDQALDQLWYDADGSSAGVAVMVADLSNNINITNLDLLLL